MSETLEAEKEVGIGSPKGVRWFVSRFPELSITMKPQDIIISSDGKERPQKAKRILFMKQIKPQRFRGSGMLGRANYEHGGDGTDRNQSPFWGVCKIDNEEMIEFLRGHEFYKKTNQNNTPEANADLKELNFDPRSLPGGDAGMVRLRTEADLKEEGADKTAAPADGSPERHAARVVVRKTK